MSKAMLTVLRGGDIGDASGDTANRVGVRRLERGLHRAGQHSVTATFTSQVQRIRP